MACRWLVFLMVLPLSIVAQQATLVRVSDAWQYFKGTSAPSTPSTAWRQIAFDDSRWLTGVGGFSIGQGYDENTLLADMPARYLSVFFRSEEHTSELQSPDHLV